MLNNIGLPGFLMIAICCAIIVVPFFQLWKRTGHSGWISLFMPVPLVNLITLYDLAFKNWPALTPPAPRTSTETI